MSRPAATILLALLATGALTAAKPVPPSDGPGDAGDQARERWRGQGISLCVAELRAIPQFGPDDLESICGCAVDRFLERAGTTPPTPLERSAFPSTIRGPLISCTAQRRPERVSDVARVTMGQPGPAPVQPPMPEAGPANDFKPVDDSDVPAGDEESGGGFQAWLSGLSWPAWLTGASILWWVAIGIFLFGLLILKIRRRDPRNDLVSPPGHMRRGAPPQPPRRPDLPR